MVRRGDVTVPAIEPNSPLSTYSKYDYICMYETIEIIPSDEGCIGGRVYSMTKLVWLLKQWNVRHYLMT